MPGSANNHPSPRDADASTRDEEITSVPVKEKGLLNWVDRISEILFGLIMTLGFTCTISVVETDSTQIRSLLIAAIGCNISWGLVDAVMYILGTLAERGHDKSILNFLHKTKHPEKAREYIADALPPVVVSVLETEGLEEVRKALLKIPEENLSPHITLDDLKIALAIFFVVFFSTIPVALPFLFIHKVQLALRISNLVAIVCMFICGWLLAQYSGYNKIQTGLAMVLLGVILVVITIVLGG
jgi:hypothetical protein